MTGSGLAYQLGQSLEIIGHSAASGAIHSTTRHRRDACERISNNPITSPMTIPEMSTLAPSDAKSKDGQPSPMICDNGKFVS